MKTNAYDELLKIAADETVEGIAFGGLDSWGVCELGKRWQGLEAGRLYTLAEVEPFMRGWSTDGDFGTRECPTLFAWTKSKVILLKEYDGSTGLVWVPRNPVAVDAWEI